MPDIETVETPQDDLRAVLAESLKSSETPAAEETPVERAEPEPKAETSGDRPRGPDGKFLPKEGADKAEGAAAEPAGEPKTKEATPQPEAETGAQTAAQTPQKGVEAPQHWSAADRQWLANIPAEHQQSVLDRFKQMEAGFTPRLQKLANYERDYQGVPELFAPHAEALRQQGRTPAQIIQSWASVEQSLLSHKGAVDRGQIPSDDAGAAIVARMIAGYRIDPGAVARVLNAMASGQYQPAPARSELPPEVVQRLQRLETAEQQREAAAQQQRLNGAQSQIDIFANEKDGEGNLKHPFFAELESEITRLAQIDASQDKTPDLADLYDRAVWANKSTRDKLLASEKEAQAKRAAAEAKAKSSAAAKAAVSVSGSPGATVPPNAGYRPSANAADDLRAAMLAQRS